MRGRPAKPHRVPTKWNALEHDQLVALAKRFKLTKSALIRKAVSDMYLMVLVTSGEKP